MSVKCYRYVRESKNVLDSGFQSLSVERRFWISIVNGTPDSLSCIPDSKDQDCRFHNAKISAVRSLADICFLHVLIRLIRCIIVSVCASVFKWC